MHGDSAGPTAHQFNLAGMHAGPNYESDRPDGRSDRLRAANGAGGSVERREESVSSRVDLTTVEAAKLGADEITVTGEQPFPDFVAELGGTLGRADDVGKEHGREYPIDPRHRP